MRALIPSNYDLFKVIVIICICTTLILLQSTSQNTNIDEKPHKIRLKSIKESKIEPNTDKNLFFIDTYRLLFNYSKSKSQRIGIRQACAIESGALLNPNLNVYVIYISHRSTQYLTITPALEAVTTYRNVKFVSIEHAPFTKDTPLEHFFINQLPLSRFPVVHASDAYRLLLLWLYGGIYLDTDVISLQSLDANTPELFACDDGEGDIVSNAIIKMRGEKRRSVVEMFMNYMIENYTPNEYGANGPLAFTAVLSRVCRTNFTSAMIKMGNCDGFHILPEESCYPISWTQWRSLFNEHHANRVMKMINGSMTIHLWNNLSKRHKIDVDKDTAFNRIAQIYCPRVYRSMKL